MSEKDHLSQKQNEFQQETSNPTQVQINKISKNFTANYQTSEDKDLQNTVAMDLERVEEILDSMIKSENINLQMLDQLTEQQLNNYLDHIIVQNERALQECDEIEKTLCQIQNNAQVPDNS